MIIKYKQINKVKMKKLNCNAVYISFFIYNNDVNIYHVNVSFCCNGAGITLGCQQIHNCDFQIKFCTQMLRTAYERKGAFVRCSSFLQQMILEN